MMLTRLTGVLLIVLALAAAAPREAKLRIGFYDTTTYALKSTDFRIGMDIWIRELSREANLTTQILYYSNPRRLAEDFSKGVINMAVATPLIFIRYFDSKLMIPGVVGYKSATKEGRRLYLLVRSEDRHTPLRQLLRHPIAISRSADTERLYLRVLALENGVDEQDLRFIRTKGESQAIYKLFFKKAQIAVVTAAAFRTACELNPQVATQIAVYRKEAIYVGNFTFLRKDIDEKTRRIILKGAQDIVKTARGRQVLAIFGVDSLGLCRVEDLDSIRDLYQRYLTLKKGDRP